MRKYLVQFSNIENDHEEYDNYDHAKSCYDSVNRQYLRGLRKDPPELYELFDSKQGLYFRIDN